MMENNTGHSLSGHILLATPKMQDDVFATTCIFVCNHDHMGAAGIILNRPLESLTFSQLMDQLEVEIPADLNQDCLHFGGPVDINRGFVLHSEDYKNTSTIPVGGGLSLSSNIEFFKNLSIGKRPKKFLVALGYSGWGPGQLEEEIRENGWVHVPATAELIFEKNSSLKWKLAIDQLGFDIDFLDQRTGTA